MGEGGFGRVVRAEVNVGANETICLALEMVNMEVLRMRRLRSSWK